MAWTNVIIEEDEIFGWHYLVPGIVWNSANWESGSSNSANWETDGESSAEWDKDVVSALVWANVSRDDDGWSYLVPGIWANAADWIAPDLLDAILLDKSFDAASESYFHTLGKFFGEPPLRGWNDEAVSSSSWDKDSSILPTWLKDSSSSTTWS